MANNKIQLGNGDVLLDLTSDTVRADKLARGYTAHDRSGVQITGTMDEGGGGGTDHDFLVTCDFDPETHTISNQSATLAEIAAAASENKDVRLYANASLYDGAAQIYLSARLIECDIINMGGQTSYKIVFVADVIAGEHDSRVVIAGLTGDNNDQLKVSYRDVYDSYNIQIEHSGTSILNVSNFSLEQIMDYISSSQGNQLKIELQDGAINHYLQLTCADGQTLTLRFYGEDDGIGYSINMQVYNDQADVPSGVFVISTEHDGDPVYIGIELRLSICAPIMIDVNTVNDGIVGHHLPNNFLKKMQISLSAGDLSYWMVRYYVINNGAVYSTLFLHGAIYGNFDDSILFSFPFPGSTSVMRFQIVASAPESGYYVDLENGQFLAIEIIQM